MLNSSFLLPHLILAIASKIGSIFDPSDVTWLAQTTQNKGQSCHANLGFWPSIPLTFPFIQSYTSAFYQPTTSVSSWHLAWEESKKGKKEKKVRLLEFSAESPIPSPICSSWASCGAPGLGFPLQGTLPTGLGSLSQPAFGAKNSLSISGGEVRWHWNMTGRQKGMKTGTQKVRTWLSAQKLPWVGSFSYLVCLFCTATSWCFSKRQFWELWLCKQVTWKQQLFKKKSRVLPSASCTLVMVPPTLLLRLHLWSFIHHGKQDTVCFFLFFKSHFRKLWERHLKFTQNDICILLVT